MKDYVNGKKFLIILFLCCHHVSVSLDYNDLVVAWTEPLFVKVTII
jgi:hypothetical protein